MKSRFSSHHKEIIQLSETELKHFSVIAIESIKQLKWNVRSVNEKTIVAYTKISMNSWGEEVSVKLEDHQAVITSACTGNQIIDWGKNRRNVEELLAVMARLKKTSTDEEWDLETIRFNEQMTDENTAESEEISFSIEPQKKGFLSVFIPRDGYFITPIIINLNILFFVCMLLNGANIMTPTTDLLLKWGANYKPLTLNNQWWRLLSSCFVHIGLFHILLNMFALVYVGRLLEPFIGRHRFLVAYVLTGLVSSASSLWWHDLTVSAGASGAIFGIYGVFLALLTTNLIEQTARKAFLTSVGIFVVYNILYGLKPDSGVDNAAHIGGLLSGLIIGFAFVPSLRKPDQPSLSSITSGILCVVVLTSVSWFCYTTPNDLLLYEKKMIRFGELERDALQVLSSISSTPQNVTLEELQIHGINYWMKAEKLVESCNKLDLPLGLQQRNWKLRDYCELRIDSYQLIYKTISENTHRYQPRIDSCNFKLEKIISELSAQQP